MINIKDFRRLDMRAGTIISVKPFPEAQKPAYKLTIDFGPQGKKNSSAQITEHYKPEDLIGHKVVAAMNLGPKRIGEFTSEVLVLGVPDADGAIVLLEPDGNIPNGAKVS